MANNTVNYDVDGYDAITNALVHLINDYPALDSGDSIKFSILGADSGKAMFPSSGAIIESERHDILGHTTQECLYPFNIIYRVGSLNENRKQKVKEWLDNLGRWLEKQPIKVGQTVHTLSAYPALNASGGLKRTIYKVSRTTPATLNAVNENNTEDWYISITAKYRNQY